MDVGSDADRPHKELPMKSGRDTNASAASTSTSTKKQKSDKSGDLAQRNAIVLRVFKDSHRATDWLEELNDELRTKGYDHITAARAYQIRDEHDKAIHLKQHRIYRLKYGTEHTLTDWASAAARYRLRCTLARKCKKINEKEAILKSEQHVRDGKLVLPGTSSTIQQLMDALYIAEVCIPLSPFIEEAKTYFDSFWERLEALVPAVPCKQMKFRLFF